MADQDARLTKTKLKERVAKVTGLTTGQVGTVLDAIVELACQQLRKKDGEFVFHGLVKLKSVKKPATKERQGRNPSNGETITVKAKPAHTVIKARVLKMAKDSAVNY